MKKGPDVPSARPLIVPRRRIGIENISFGKEAAALGIESSLVAVVAEDECLDFFIRKNEAILGGMVGFFILSMQSDEVGGLVELVRFLGEAVGLELAEQSEGFFELAGEALAVEAEICEGAGVGIERSGDGESGTDLLSDIFEGSGLADDAQGQEIVFESAHAILPPGGVGQRLDELAFGGAFGVVFGYETLDVLLVGFQVVGREDDGLAGESVA